MKFLWFFAALVGVVAYANLQNSDKQELNDLNLLENGGFENGLAKWAYIGVHSPFNVVDSNSTVLIGAGARSAAWNASTVERLQTPLYTIPGVLLGKTCQASIHTSTVGAGYHLVAANNWGSVIASAPIASSIGRYLQNTVTFPCLAEHQNIRLQVQSERDADPIYLDQAYLGSAPNLTDISLSTVLASNAYGWFVDAVIVTSGGSADVSLSLSSDITSYDSGVLESGNLTLTNNSSSATAQIACSGTFEASGTFCGSSTESLGIAFTIPYSGTYLACAEFPHRLHVGAGANYGEIYFQLHETSNTAQASIQTGKAVAESGMFLNTGSDEIMSNPIHLCGTFTFSTAGKKTIRLRYNQDLGNNMTVNSLPIDNSASGGNRNFRIFVTPMNQSILGLALPNQVVTPQTSGVRVATSAHDQTTTTCAPTREDGDYISSTERPGLGVCNVNFTAGTFSATPNCYCTSQARDTTCGVVSVATSTVSIESSSDAGASTDQDFNLLCIGTR